MSKVDSSHWPELVRGDTRGTRIFAAEHLSEISNQLEKFTSDKVQFGLHSMRNTSFHQCNAVLVWCLLWSTVCLSVTIWSSVEMAGQIQLLLKRVYP